MGMRYIRRSSPLALARLIWLGRIGMRSAVHDGVKSRWWEVLSHGRVPKPSFRVRASLPLSCVDSFTLIPIVFVDGRAGRRKGIHIVNAIVSVAVFMVVNVLILYDVSTNCSQA